MSKSMLKKIKDLFIYNYEYIFKLTPKERYLIERIKDYTLASEAYRSYKEEVRGNEYNTYLICQRKLLRNIVIGKRLDSMSDEEIEYFMYGDLRIGINNRFQEIFYAAVDKEFEDEDFSISDDKKRLVERMLLD